MSQYIKKGRKNPTPQKVDRNQAILEDRAQGMSFTELARKYNLTSQRCYAICKTYGKKEVTA